MEKIGHVSVRVLVSTSLAKLLMTKINFFKILHEIFGINVKLNFYLILLLGFLIFSDEKYGSQIFVGLFWLPIFRHGPIWLKIFMETRETFIYRLVMRNPCYDAYFLV